MHVSSTPVFRPPLFGQSAWQREHAELDVSAGKSLQGAWHSPGARQLIQCAIADGNYREAPGAARQFLDTINRLTASVSDPESVYRQLRELFRRQVAHNGAVRDSFSCSQDERVVRRVGQVTSLIGDERPGFYLDIGGGDGRITEALTDRLDVPAAVLEVVKPPDATSRVPYFLYDGDRFPLASNSVGLITLFTVLHHAEHPDKVIQEAFRALKPGGILLVREFDAPTEDLKRFNLVMDEIYYRVYSDEPNVPRPGHFYAESTWHEMFVEAGFGIEKNIRPEPGNPYRPFMTVLRKPQAE